MGLILKYREDGEFPLHIKDQRDYHSGFKVYFRMSVAQFDALLAILEPHIKRKTTNFCELSVMKWMNLTIAILDFDVRLYSGSELSKHFSKCLPRMQKNAKNPDPNFLWPSKLFLFFRHCVNVIDIMWGHIYFSKCKHFGQKFQTLCAMTLRVMA